MAGVLISVQLPVFVDQYGQRLDAHYQESDRSVGAFRDDAKKFFNGDMEKLITYYKTNGDPVFHDGGESIESIYSRYLTLKKALANFQKGLWSAYSQAFIYPVADIQAEVRSNYSYAIKLDATAIVLGIAGGFMLALLGEGVLRGIIAVLSVLRKRPQRTAQ